jgi:cytidine deaminase
MKSKSSTRAKSLTNSKVVVSPTVKLLWKLACRAQKQAHAPYSQFHVGAAIASGRRVFLGCNVENASYGGTVCAERVAVFKAVSEGVTKFDTLVVVVPGDGLAPPCGFCLQVLSEFNSGDLNVYLGSSKKITRHFRLKDLLPHSFRATELRS